MILVYLILRNFKHVLKDIVYRCHVALTNLFTCLRTCSACSLFTMAFSVCFLREKVTILKLIGVVVTYVIAITDDDCTCCWLRYRGVPKFWTH